MICESLCCNGFAASRSALHAGGQWLESVWLHSLKPLRWRGFLVSGGSSSALSHSRLGRFLERFRDKNLVANRFAVFRPSCLGRAIELWFNLRSTHWEQF